MASEHRRPDQFTVTFILYQSLLPVPGFNWLRCLVCASEISS